MAAVAVADLYLGAQWLTDVTGGVALAAAWLAAWTVVDATREKLPWRVSQHRQSSA
ncbi:hypothetical protein [Georgenia yuyongxinii]|uniref:hypothetical protein n=1 Tax=Georgenia yuyongxinii TaxID=2589797 RepID=UPI00163DCA73|nr:hypothetical protein [Georgenia yuyongxinii]